MTNAMVKTSMRAEWLKITRTGASKGKAVLRPEIVTWLKENCPRRHKVVGDYYIAFDNEGDEIVFLLQWVST